MAYTKPEDLKPGDELDSNYEGCDLHLRPDDIKIVFESLVGSTVKAKKFKKDGSVYQRSCGCDGLKTITVLNKRSKFTTMKKLTNTIKKLVDKDVQDLLKAEYMNGDLELTEKGKDALVNMLFLENKAKLADEARVEIAEAEKKA